MMYSCSPLFVPTFVTLGRGFGFFLEFPGGFVTWIVPYLFSTLLPTWFCYINCSQICSWQPVCYINCSQICSWQPVCYMNCSQICSRQPGLLHELFPNFTPWTEIETTARNKPWSIDNIQLYWLPHYWLVSFFSCYICTHTHKYIHIPLISWYPLYKIGVLEFWTPMFGADQGRGQRPHQPRVSSGGSNMGGHASTQRRFLGWDRIEIATLSMGYSWIYWRFTVIEWWLKGIFY